MKPRCGWLLLLLAGVSQQVLHAAEERDARGWLREMEKSVKTLNYQGNFVYLYDENLELMRVVHTYDSNGERERLISLNGAAREVVRDDASVTCIAPDSKSVLINGRNPGAGLVFLSGTEAKNLDHYYDFRLLDLARIAGRLAQTVAIFPRDHYRYGYRISLDQKSALPLKTDMLDTSGAVISQMMFTSIQIDSATQTLFVAQGLEGREDYLWEQPRPSQLVQGSDDIGWYFDGLPQGYTLNLKARIQAGPEDQYTTEHFVVSDGLASLSVYVEAMGEETGLVGRSQMGAVNAFGRQTTDGYQITAVGTVPAVTVEAVAMALRRTSDP